MDMKRPTYATSLVFRLNLKAKVKVSHSVLYASVTLWTAVRQSPLSMEFSS